jgi:hypothetical protein
MEVRESYDLIKSKFEYGVYSLQKMVEFVDKKWITEEQFHWITSYSYRGLKKAEAGDLSPASFLFI